MNSPNTFSTDESISDESKVNGDCREENVFNLYDGPRRQSSGITLLPDDNSNHAALSECSFSAKKIATNKYESVSPQTRLKVETCAHGGIEQISRHRFPLESSKDKKSLKYTDYISSSKCTEYIANECEKDTDLSFGFENFLESLPPIPTSYPHAASIDFVDRTLDPKKHETPSDISQNLQRDGRQYGDDSCYFKIVAEDLPPIPPAPMYSKGRSNLAPNDIQDNQADYAERNGIIPLDSLPPVPLPIAAHKKCKISSCSFFMNEGLDGYCSDCFMCCNISENVPPANFASNSSDIVNTIATLRCKNSMCEFFGNDQFNGYCSQCFKSRSNHDQIFSTPDIGHNECVISTQSSSNYMPVTEDELHDDYGDLDNNDEDDDKLCIVCLQVAYNTVLLPCGHLYLCYECAISIKKRNEKCPACRSLIESLHRVYTPN